MHLDLFILSEQTTNYVNGTQKQPIQQISNDFSPFLLSLCCALCVFLINHINLQAMHQSVSPVSRKLIVIQSVFWGFYILIPRGLLPGDKGQAGPNKKKITFLSPLRNSPLILTSNIGNMMATKYPLNVPHACH